MRCSDGLAHDLELVLEVFSRDVHDGQSRERGSTRTGCVEVDGVLATMVWRGARWRLGVKKRLLHP